MKTFWNALGHFGTLMCALNMFLAVVLILIGKPYSATGCVLGAGSSFVGALSAFSLAEKAGGAG